MKDWEKEFENNIANYQNGIKLSDIINPDYLKDFIQDCITAREKEIVEAVSKIQIREYPENLPEIGARSAYTAGQMAMLMLIQSVITNSKD